MHSAETTVQIPVSLKGGLFKLPNGQVEYVKPWYAWWLAKIWTGRVLPHHTRWHYNISRTEIERDYLCWAKEHSEMAFHSIELEHAMYQTCGLYEQHWKELPLVFIGSLDWLRSKWDANFFPVEWPDPSPMMQLAAKPHRRLTINHQSLLQAA